MKSLNEDFLHFIWRFQKLKTNHLTTQDEQKIIVFDPGQYNTNAGPDFLHARIKIDQIEWVGHVEVHIHSSDWDRHRHSEDEAYHNVILHVVWKHDLEIRIKDQHLPTLELQSIIDLQLLNHWTTYNRSKEEILCSSYLPAINPLLISNMIEKVGIERLERKAEGIQKELRENKNDWDAVFYRMMAANFGFGINKLSFQELVETLPFDVFRKIQDVYLLESVLFGQAGFLDEVVDEYQEKMLEDYLYLASKYQLTKRLSRSMWRFSKLRPANFPTLRISQFAHFIANDRIDLQMLIDNERPDDIIRKEQIAVSSYWKDHYDFGKKFKRAIQGQVGKQSLDMLIINVVCPILAAYSKFVDDQKYMDRAIEILLRTRSESNKITRKWKAKGIQLSNAFDSQSVIQLFNHYCLKKRCLSCTIGIKILDNDLLAG
jgi:hypothetical protein